MKEWNNPELLSLGVESTFEGTEPIASDSNMHYCHALGKAHSTSECKGSEHDFSNGCHLKDAEGHYWNGQWLSKCCCTES